MTETAHEVATLQGLDFEPPCERHSRPKAGGSAMCGGSSPAEWVMVTTPCCDGRAKVLLYCTPCKAATLDMWALKCDSCDYVYEPALSAYVSVTPLRADR